MNRNSRNMIILAAAALSLPVAAQSLDPTVNVTRAYEGKLLEVDKPATLMAVPDSVTRFNLDFDYSVLESPYRVGDEFNPYLQEIRPEQAPPRSGRFHLRAGAGYTLRPELDLVWAMFDRNRFHMNFYASNRSYYGNYRRVECSSGSLDSSQSRSRGYDASTRAGFNGRYDWADGSFIFDAAYVGIAAADSSVRGADGFYGVCSNGADVRARVRSVGREERFIFYDAMLRYGFVQNDFRSTSAAAPDYIREHRARVASSVGPVFSSRSAALVDLDMDVAAYQGNYPNLAFSGRISLTPKYRFADDRWKIEAGVKTEFLLRRKGALMNAARGQVAYPKVNVNYAAAPDRLNIYLRADGGADINAFSSVLEGRHFLDPAYFARGSELDNTIERVNARIGIDGNIACVFRYDLRAGYACYGNCLLDQVVSTDSGLVPALVSGRSMDGGFNLQTAYAALDFGAMSECIDITGALLWRYSFYGKDCPEKARAGFLPSPLSGDIRLVYNWRRRIFAGVSAEGTLGRRGRAWLPGEAGRDDSGEEKAPSVLTDVRIPGYLDLGLEFEYKVSPKFGVWARGGNLACMAIQRTLMHVESGPWATVGISLNL